MKKYNYFPLFCFVLFFPESILSQESQTLKFGTFLPKGTVYTRYYYQMKKDIEKKTNKQLMIKIFPGGTAGTEEQMLKNLKKGKLDMALFSGIQLAKIVTKIKALEIPYFFKTRGQKYKVIKKLYPEFQNDFSKKGFILAGWGDVGDIYTWTQVPVTSLNHYKKIKLWLPSGEPMAKAMYQGWGVTGYHSTFEELLNNLKKGHVTAFLISPAASIGLGWSRYAKYIIYPRVIFSYSIAVVIRKESYDMLPKEYQNLLVNASEKATKKMTNADQYENTNALRILKKKGYQILNMDKELLASLKSNAIGTEKKLVQWKLFTKDFLNQVKKFRDN